MKRLFSLFRRKPKKVFYHINYSDKVLGRYVSYIGTVRGQNGNIIGQFQYYVTELGAVVKSFFNQKFYYIANASNPTAAAIDGYIHPYFGGMYNAHSLTEFIKIEFGL